MEGEGTRRVGWRGPAIAAVIIAVALAAGLGVRSHLDFVPEPRSIQSWVAALEWRGPVFFVVLFVFRQFLLLPAGLLLPVAGLCFGALVGTALGTLAIMLSGLMKFGLARAMRRGWVVAVPRRIDGLGSVVVGLLTAHPMGPLAWVHWGAGFSAIRLAPFALALALGAPVRAFAYSYLGSSLVDGNSASLNVAAGVLLAAVVVPLLHPGIRRRFTNVLRGQET